ncbi:MAG TPA: MFS transporter [Microlunatus sp.]|nr:MFS transporter [Microlunatus sp.]
MSASEDADPPAQPPAEQEGLPLSPLAGVVILIALVLAAFNLRPAVTSVGPLLEEIRTGLGMGGVVAGLLTALPAACFVAFGSLAPRLVARTFPSRLIWISLAAVTVGLAVRPFMPGTATFVLVSCLALGGIGVANIMMPVVVRRAFPQRVGTVTGVYSMGLTLGAATAAAVTVPLTTALGGDWRYGLAFWAVPAALAMVLWMGVARWIRQRAGGRPAGASSGGLRITRSRTAWAVAILFGLQSTQAYVTMGWVPQIYRDAGLSATYAGVLLALIPAVGVPTSFLVPTLAARLRNQGGVAVALTGLGFIGYLGLWIMPTTAPWLWVIVLGISQGVFPLALTLIGLRTRSAAGTVGLSSFGQSVGYLISIPGPIVVGALYGATGGWHLPLALLLVLLIPQGIAGVFAGRSRFVEDDLGA